MSEHTEQPWTIQPYTSADKVIRIRGNVKFGYGYHPIAMLPYDDVAPEE